MQFSAVLDVIAGRCAAEPSRAATYFDDLTEPLVAFDLQRVIIDATELAERFYGYEHGELIGKRIDVLIPARLRQHDAPAPVATSEITTVELPALRRDGTEVMTVWSYAAVGAPDPFFVLQVRERTQVLADLEASTYATVFESSPVPIALSRVADDTTIAMNQAFADLFELRREDFIGRTSIAMGIATPEQREEVARILRDKGAVRDVECERRTATGKPIHVSLTVMRVRIGGADHLMSTVQDISARKAQEAALAQAREAAEQERQKFRSVFVQAPVAICILEGPEHRFTFANSRYRALVGGRDVVGKPLLEALPDVRDKGFDKFLDRVRATGEPFSAQDVPVKLAHHGSDESLIIDFIYQPIRGEDGSVNAIVAVIVDVTERATTEAKLKMTAMALVDSRARADYAVLLSGLGFWYCDLPFDELTWDDTVKNHFFLPRDARVTIDTFYERIVPADRERTRAAIDAAIQGRTLYDVQYRTHDAAAGDVKWIRAMGGSSYAPDGTPTRFDGVTLDITTQKHDEERLAAAAAQLEEANRVKDQFLAMLGHELRNPLAPITMAVELLKLRRADEREIKIIERQAAHLTRLVDDLLDVSRITRGQIPLDKQPCEIDEIVRAAIETASPLIASGEHSVTTDVPTYGLAVDLDRVRMVQVLSNLLSNAAKYTPSRGEIRVKARRDENDVVIWVEDTGEGIDEDLLPHVFDMFVQSQQSLDRSQGGLGLGLAIVKNLVTMHGGRVSAHSAGLGKGSTFEIRIPAAQRTHEYGNNGLDLETCGRT